MSLWVICSCGSKGFRSNRGGNGRTVVELLQGREFKDKHEKFTDLGEVMSEVRGVYVKKIRKS